MEKAMDMATGMKIESKVGKWQIASDRYDHRMTCKPGTFVQSSLTA